MSLTEKIEELKNATAEQTLASQALAQEVANKMSGIDNKVAKATTVVRNTIRGYNAENYFIDSVNGSNDNSGESPNESWNDLAPLADLLVYGKSYNIHLAAGQRVKMPRTLRVDNAVILFQSDYDQQATLVMETLNYLGTHDGTVSFIGNNLVLKLFGVTLETATLKPESTTRSTSYRSAAVSREHSAGNFNIELYRGGIDIKDFPLIRSAMQNSGFVCLNLGATSQIKISEGGESKLAYTNDHLGLSNGSVSSIDNAHGTNTWNAILSGVGGNSNVVADFDFEAQV